MKTKHILLAFLLAAAPVLAAPAGPPAPGSYEAWQLHEPAKRQAGELRKTDAKAAAAVLEAEIAKCSDPNSAADMFTFLGEIYTVELKDPAKTVEVMDRALPLFNKANTQVPAYHFMTMVAAKANALALLKKGEEAEKLLTTHWAQFTASVNADNTYAQRTVRDCLRAQIATLESQGKDAQVAEVLGNFLVGAPHFFNLKSWDAGAWVYNELQSRLQKAEKWDEALGWAKLNYQLCQFDKSEIERATQALGKVWAAQDDFAASGMFAKAQTDAALKNPLVAAKTPTVSEETRAALQKRIADLEGRQLADFKADRARIIVKYYIALGTPTDLKNAMKSALSVLKEHPEVQDGSLTICRVFKAADCNLIRANAFLAYMNGEGANPVPEFLKK